MSTITNPSFLPGDTTLASTLNAKFTDLATATTGGASTGLDEKNFRQESIDLNQFDSVSNSGKSGIILRDWQMTDNGVSASDTPTAYVSVVDTGLPVELSHGSGCQLSWPLGLSLEAADVVRVHWHVWADSVVVDSDKFSSALPIGTGFDAGTTYSTLVATYPEMDEPVWLVWLQWDITDNTLTNWEEVPNQEAFETAFGIGTHGGYAADSAATMVIPHGVRYVESSQLNLEHIVDLALRRSYNLIVENPTTVYGFRLVLKGLFHPKCDSDTNNLNAFVQANGPGWEDETIYIGGVTLGALVMRSN